MDVSELVPLCVSLLVVILASTAWWRGRRIASKPARLTIRILSALIAVAAALVLASFAIVYVGYTRHLPPVVSPDGRHVALTEYTINSGSSTSMAEVSLRKSWVPYSYRVYFGPGQYEPKSMSPEPWVLWTDATHLTIRFHHYEGATNGEQGCSTQAAGITITCEETRVIPTKR